MPFHEVYGDVPGYILTLFKRYNVTQSDWDAMLARWGYRWDDDNLPWSAIESHVKTHSQRGYYQYPLYG